MLRSVLSADRFAPHRAPSGASGPGFSDRAEPFAPLPQRSLPQGQPRIGLNFATQDYLSLSTHPTVRLAALAALGRPRTDPTAQVATLEARMAAFLRLSQASVHASGADAIRATLLAVLHPGDDVLVDPGAHPAMAESVLAARADLHRCPTASVDAVERRLARLARQRRTGRLFLAVSAISAFGSRMADLADLSALARRHAAHLIVDVSHDLGAMGPEGRGVQELQGCLGRIDVVVGSFAKTFAAPGGFAALGDPALIAAAQLSQPRWTALSPVNAAVILTALALVDSAEGRRRRLRLHGCALRLRNHLMADGVKILGQASPFVPVRLPLPTALARTELLQSAGPKVNLVQAPLVPRHAPRWRIQLTADHGAADIDDLAELIRDVSRVFVRQTRPTLARVSLTQD
jgi:7-keto-8-aminopelargonate synthetase-like enzyme